MTMSSRSSSTTTTIALASFLVGCGVTTATVLVFSILKQQQQQKKQPQKNEIKQQQNRTLPPEIRAEQLSRHTLFLGESGMTKLVAARVCVVGVGGVGSHAAHMLARSGIGHVRIIDFDQITVSSLNRHACATLQHVGRSKVHVLADFLRQICPDPNYLKIEGLVEMFTAENGERLLALDDDKDDNVVRDGGDSSSSAGWDMVIDCIDDVRTKAALLEHCLRNNIRVVSCMGAGGKADPTRLHISDLSSASKDPLASKIRQTLKQQYNHENDDDTSYLDDMERLTVLFSSEKTAVKLADFTDEQKERGVHHFGAVDGMRIRVVPVLGTMPALMGQALAGICLTVLAGHSLQPVTGERVGRNTRNKIYQMLRTREQTLSVHVREAVAQAGPQNVTVQHTTGPNGNGELITIRHAGNNSNNNNNNSTTFWIGPLQIDQADDVEYLMEIWRNRCAVTGARLGTVLHLIRWDWSRPSTCDNLVLVSANVLPKFVFADNSCCSGDIVTAAASVDDFKAKMDPKVRSSIVQRLASCRIDR